MSGKSKPYNFDHYQKRQSEMEKADRLGDYEGFCLRIGIVTTSFEMCEYLLFCMLKTLRKEPAMLGAVFSVINSRSSRIQFIEQFIEDCRPKRRSSKFERLEAAFKEYQTLGKRRDEVAHGMLNKWEGEFEALLLQPSQGTERHFVAGLPKYHYDIPSIDMLISRMNALYEGLASLLWEEGERRLNRLKRRQGSKPTAAPDRL